MGAGRRPQGRHGLVVGRFQPLHKGHEQLIRQALAECDRVTVAIGSSQAAGTLRDPFSAAERTQMVRAVFGEGVDVSWIPDIHDPPHWVDHVRNLTAPFDVVYGNDEATVGLFEDAGAATVRPGLMGRGLWQATLLRKLMAQGDPAWRDAVSDEVVGILEKLQGPQRLQHLAREHGRVRDP